MKLTKFFAIGFSAMALAVTGCQVKAPYESISGVDSSKAKPTELTLDVDNMSATSIAVYWDGAAAVEAGATTFTCQIVQNFDDAGDTYNSTTSKTIEAVDDAGNVNDAATFTKLTAGALYYVRVRANYRYSVVSDWVYLEREGAVVQVSVGNGVVISEFVAPVEMTASALTYNSATARWALVGPAEGYEVYVKAEGASDWTLATTCTNSYCTISGLTQLTSYEVAVRAYRTVDGNKEYTDYSESVTIVTPEKPQFGPGIKTAEELSQFFVEIAAQAGSEDAYYLENDIDMAGANIECAPAFAGTLDGKGFTLKNAKILSNAFTSLAGTVKDFKFSGVDLGDGFIKTVEEGGLVSGLSFDATCKQQFPDPSEAASFGTVANFNDGTVEKCSSAIAYTQSVTKLPADTNFGAIVGKSTGLVSECTNTGNRTLDVTTPTSGKYHTMSGVVGLATGKEGQVLVKDCSNSGAISVTFATACYFNTAGVVGSTNIVKQSTEAPVNQGIIDNCSNTGALSVHYISGGSGAYPMCGGVCGSIDGVVSNCWNDAPLSLVCDSESATWTCQRVGGVAATITFGAKNLVNKSKGKFTISALVAGGTAGARGAGCIETSCWGGVVSNCGPYAPDNTIVFEGLVNECEQDFEANSITGTPNHHIGAVVGYATGTLKDCHNKADFKFKSPVAYSRLGGVVGGTKCDVIGCTNSGAITLDMGALATGSTVIGTGKFAGYVGGIIGCNRLTTEVINITDCSNTGTLTVDSSSAVCASIYKNLIGGILCCYKSGTEPVITNCTNTGAMNFVGSIPGISADMMAGVYQQQ